MINDEIEGQNQVDEINFEEIVENISCKDYRKLQSLLRIKGQNEEFKIALEESKEEAKEIAKAEKEAELAKLAEIGKEKVIAAGIGGKISVQYGKEILEAVIKNINPAKKTFAIRIEGNPSDKLWRYYHQVV